MSAGGLENALGIGRHTGNIITHFHLGFVTDPPLPPDADQAGQLLPFAGIADGWLTKDSRERPALKDLDPPMTLIHGYGISISCFRAIALRR